MATGPGGLWQYPYYGDLLGVGDTAYLGNGQPPIGSFIGTEDARVVADSSPIDEKGDTWQTANSQRI